MQFSGAAILLAFVTTCCARGVPNVRRASVAIIPSGTPTNILLSTVTSTSQAQATEHSKKVNDFFHLYGWLKPGTNITIPELPKAIQKIQKTLKQPVTGEFNKNISDVLARPHCGTIPPYNETDAKLPAALQKRYVAWGPKWAKTSLTWRFLNYTADLPAAQQQTTVNSAFAQWMSYMPLTITPAATNTKSDINIRFVSFGRDDTRYAYTSMVSDGTSMWSGNINITFNDDYTWSDDRLFNFTALHEIGHSLGLSHSAVEDAVMFAYYDGYIRPLHPDDKMGIHTIYGWKSPQWTRIDASSTSNNIFTVTSATTTNANDGLYQMRSTGQILRYSNIGSWVSVDNNRDTVQAAGAGGYLYQRHKDGSLYRWTGTGSNWQYIGAASEKSVDITAAADSVYSRRADGNVTRWSGTGTSWTVIEQPSGDPSRQVAVSDSKLHWNLLQSGTLVRTYYPYDVDTGQIVDINTANIAIAVGGEEFYKLQSDGTVVWLNLAAYYWQIIENANSVAIYASGDYIYSKHGDGTIWRWTNTQYVWEQLDNRAGSAVAGDRSGNVWELLTNGEIYKLVS